MLLRTEVRSGFTPPRTLLRRSAALWLVTAIAGQLIFAIYIAGLYGRSALAGNMSGWNAVMPHGYVRGDALGNSVIAAHLLLAVVIIIGGAAQLTPWIRRRVPAVHRWTGRMYLVSSMATSLAGLYLTWVRGSVGDMSQHIAISLNALILLSCATVAWRSARARDFVAHRRWALRTFLAAGGVFFFRLGLMLWVVLFRRPVGFDPHTFTGPFLTVLAFAVYVVVPLTVLELYLSAESSRRRSVQAIMALAMVVLSIVTGAAIAVTTVGMWLPRL